jgi:CheY-like chemotaxis protein
MTTNPEILLIEDDDQIRRFLRPTLAAENYRLHEAVTAAEGVAQAAARQPDLVLLDLGLPDGDGLTVIGEIRAWSAMPILVISERGQERDKIAALDAGTVGGYATDVLDEEPPPADHPLLKHPKALITPHIGSRTYESVPRQAMRATLNLVNYLGGAADVIQANRW